MVYIFKSSLTSQYIITPSIPAELLFWRRAKETLELVDIMTVDPKKRDEMRPRPGRVLCVVRPVILPTQTTTHTLSAGVSMVMEGSLGK